LLVTVFASVSSPIPPPEKERLIRSQPSSNDLYHISIKSGAKAGGSSSGKFALAYESSTVGKPENIAPSVRVTLIAPMIGLIPRLASSFYTNLRDANSQIHQSDTQILYNDGLPLQIIDPNGFFSDVLVTINEINENKKQVVFEITFAKPMDTSNIIIRAWDPYFNSRDAFILDAFEVVSEIIEEPPTPTFEVPVIEELESQSIPKWIKNNAAWWSDQQISDSDFVAGIVIIATHWGISEVD